MNLERRPLVILVKKFNSNKAQKLHNTHILFTCQRRNITQDQAQAPMETVAVAFLLILMS